MNMYVRARCCALVAVAGLSLSSAALGQSAISSQSGWSYTPSALAQNYINAALTLDGTAGTAAEPANAGFRFSTTGSSTDVLWGRVIASASRVVANPNDRFVINFQTFRQAFTLAETSQVNAPSILRGSVGFLTAGGLPVAGNVSTSQITTNIRLQRETAPGSGVWFDITNYNQNPAAQPNAAGGGANFNAFNRGDLGVQNPAAPTPAGFGAASGNVNPARQYRVLYDFGIRGDALGPAGSRVAADFLNGANGFTASINAQPAALAYDPRSGIRADSGRSTYGVTGAGITVGVIETGQVWTSNSTLPAARVAVNAGAIALDNAAYTYNSEHALAVGSIIAGNAANQDSRGVAPGANLDSVPLSSYGSSVTALTNLFNRAPRVINMSANAGSLTQTVVDNLVTTSMNGAGTRDVTMVVSAGNAGSPAAGGDSTNTTAQAFNVISVGALNRDGTTRAAFSSYNDSGTGKMVDLVAPGEYIKAAAGVDLNNDGNIDQRDYEKVFQGATYNRQTGAAVAGAGGNPTQFGGVSGDISGTSFSAPLVSGATALMCQKADALGKESDHRVFKAILMNSAIRGGITRSDANGAATTGWQQEKWYDGAGNLVVRQAVDPQLGGGMLNVKQSLATLSGGEINASDNNNQQHRQYDASNLVPLTPPTGDTYTGFWDRDIVKAQAGADEGTVTYKLGDISGQFFRAALAWDYDTAAGEVPHLEFILSWASFTGPSGIVVYSDDYNPFANTRLFDLRVPTLTLGGEDVFDSYYLTVRNLSAIDVTFGLAVQIPTPGGAMLLVAGGLLAGRRRRRTA